MWFNSTQREEPYQGLTCLLLPSKRLEETTDTGGAWLSSARVVRCWVKSRNERNPFPLLPSFSWGLKGYCRCKSEEGGDDVKSSCPLCPGRHTCYNGRYKETQSREGEPIPQSRSQFGLESATRLHEAGIASNRESAMSR